MSSSKALSPRLPAREMICGSLGVDGGQPQPDLLSWQHQTSSSPPLGSEGNSLGQGLQPSTMFLKRAAADTGLARVPTALSYHSGCRPTPCGWTTWGQRPGLPPWLLDPGQDAITHSCKMCVIMFTSQVYYCG